MPRRVNKKVLVGLVIVLVLSIGISASAQLAGDPVGGPEPIAQPPIGGSAGAAVAAGEAQMGKPFVYGTDGPDTFSCSGLIRYVLRTTGVDPEAPWTPEEYLGRYAPVDPVNIQPGDVVIYPDWATMYVGDGMLLDANQITGTVTHTPMMYAGEPLGIVRPYL